MVAISKILHFISHHGVYTAIILIFLFCFIAVRTKNAKWMILIIPLALANGFGSQFLNAWFLNRFGTESTAIITADITTNSMLNYEYIHKYEAIVQKQDGKFVSMKFSTTTAAIYPIRNIIRIPQSGKPFPVKYIPGNERNIVILYDQSEEDNLKVFVFSTFMLSRFGVGEASTLLCTPLNITGNFQCAIINFLRDQDIVVSTHGVNYLARPSARLPLLLPVGYSP